MGRSTLVGVGVPGWQMGTVTWLFRNWCAVAAKASRFGVAGSLQPIQPEESAFIPKSEAGIG